MSVISAIAAAALYVYALLVIVIVAIFMARLVVDTIREGRW